MGERGPALPGCPRCPPPALGMRPVRVPRSAGAAAPPAGDKARSRSQAAGMGLGVSSEAAPGAAALGAGKGCPGRGRLPLPGYPPSARAAAGTRPGQGVHTHTDTPAPTTLRGGKGLREGNGGGGPRGPPEPAAGLWRGRGAGGEAPALPTGAAPQPRFGSGRQRWVAHRFSPFLATEISAPTGGLLRCALALFNPFSAWFDLLSLPEMEVLKWSKYLY